MRKVGELFRIRAAIGAALLSLKCRVIWFRRNRRPVHQSRVGVIQFLRLRIYATTLLVSSASRTTFGMVGCDVCKAAFKAIAVMPGVDAIVVNLGALAFGERSSRARTA